MPPLPALPSGCNPAACRPADTACSRSACTIQGQTRRYNLASACADDKEVHRPVYQFAEPFTTQVNLIRPHPDRHMAHDMRSSLRLSTYYVLPFMPAAIDEVLLRFWAQSQLPRSKQSPTSPFSVGVLVGDVEGCTPRPAKEQRKLLELERW